MWHKPLLQHWTTRKEFGNSPCPCSTQPWFHYISGHLPSAPAACFHSGKRRGAGLVISTPSPWLQCCSLSWLSGLQSLKQNWVATWVVMQCKKFTWNAENISSILGSNDRCNYRRGRKKKKKTKCTFLNQSLFLLVHYLVSTLRTLLCNFRGGLYNCVDQSSALEPK